MFAIFKREVKSYFYSPIAYILMGLFILLGSFVFSSNIANSGYAELNSVLSFLGIVLLFIVPMLTMRTLAEERKNGTEVLLVTSPANITSIVIGKYLAAFSVFFVMTALTFVYPLIMLSFGKLAVAQLIGGYFGFILLGATFISVGVFASSITENQIVAAVISFVSLLSMWLIDGLAASFGGTVAKVMGWFSLMSRYQDFNMGILGLSPVVYYLSFTAVFIFLTIRAIEKRRWSQG